MEKPYTTALRLYREVQELRLARKRVMRLVAALEQEEKRTRGYGHYAGKLGRASNRYGS